VLTISEDVNSGPRPMPMARATMVGAVPIEAGTQYADRGSARHLQLAVTVSGGR
jgi:hypothetical protein